MTGSEADMAFPNLGERARDARISRRQDVFDLIEGSRFHVLVLSLRRLSEDEVAAITEDPAALWGAGKMTHLVARLTLGLNREVEVVECADLSDRYGLHDNEALVLVRPDGHVAWRAESFDRDGRRPALAGFGFSERPAQGVEGVAEGGVRP